MLIPFGVFSAAGAGGGAAAGSYDLISTTILGSSAASVTFDVTGLGSTYKHLQVRAVTKNTTYSYADNMLMRFNGDSGSNYSRHALQGNGSSVSSFANTSQTEIPIGSFESNVSDSKFAVNVIDILDPFSSSKNKTARNLHGNSTQPLIRLTSGAWFSTSAITSIYFFIGSGGNYAAGSRFSIYGVKG